jgi:hypothetical protein
VAQPSCSTCDCKAEHVARHVARHGLLRPHTAPARQDLWAHVAAIAKVEHLVMPQGRQPGWPPLLGASGGWRLRGIAWHCGDPAMGCAGAQPLGVWLACLARERSA